MKANYKPNPAKLTPALGTSIIDQEAVARTADITLAMADPVIGRINAASRPDVRKPTPILQPEPQPETLDNEPTPMLMPRPTWGR